MPVTRAKPVAPARSITAFTLPKTAPWAAAATTTSRQLLCLSVAEGESSSWATARQRRLNSAPATIPPSTLNTRPKGLYRIFATVRALVPGRADGEPSHVRNGDPPPGVAVGNRRSSALLFVRDSRAV